MEDACALADRGATLLQCLTPPDVWRAERLGVQSSEEMRTLLEFHQNVVSLVATNFSFALPCARALRAIARHAPSVVELGAGSGLWAELLRRGGVPVDAFDVAPPRRRFGRVDQGGPASAGGASGAAALLLCWPPLECEAPVAGQRDGAMQLMALDALRAYRGPTLLYIGEWRGCTGLVSHMSSRTCEHGQQGGERFQAAVEAGWSLVERVALPRWPGFADALYVFRRRGQGGSGVEEPTANEARPPREAEEPAPPPTPSERVRALLADGLRQPPAIAAALVLGSLT